MKYSIKKEMRVLYGCVFETVFSVYFCGKHVQSFNERKNAIQSVRERVNNRQYADRKKNKI